ncbi:5815_t:CDS:2, partial [Gigaspora margarita]
GILYAAKKNIPHKKLKKGAPNNIRSNKFDKNSASAIFKKDVISLSRIYKSLKCQYKTTEAANLSEDVVANFNHQFILNKCWAAEIEKEKTKCIEDLVNQRCAMIKNEQERMIQNPKEVLTKTKAHFQQQFAKRQTKLEQMSND